MDKWTVFSFNSDTRESYADTVWASSGLNSFAKVTGQRSSETLEFVAAVKGDIPSHEIEFPGESLVDSSTVREQPEVFGEVEDA